MNGDSPAHMCCQAKKKHYDTELENLEKHQKQTIEKMEEKHSIKLKDETKRIKAEQERDYHKFQDQLKHKKKEVRATQEIRECSCILVLLKVQWRGSLLYIQVKQSVDKLPRSQRKETLKQRMNTFQEKKMKEVSLCCKSKQVKVCPWQKKKKKMFVI